MHYSTHEESIRAYLAEHGGSVHDAGGRQLSDEMARAIGVDKPAMLGPVLEQMEKDGMITRETRGFRTFRIALVTTDGATSTEPAPPDQNGPSEIPATDPPVPTAAATDASPVVDDAPVAEPAVEPAAAVDAASEVAAAVEAAPEAEPAVFAEPAVEPAAAVGAEPAVEPAAEAEPAPSAPVTAISLREALAQRAAAAAAATAATPTTSAAEGVGPADTATIAVPSAMPEPDAASTRGGGRRWSRPRLTVPVPEVNADPTKRILIAVGAAVGLLVLIAIVSVLATRHPSSQAPVFGSADSETDACHVVTAAEATAAFGDTAGIPHFVLGTCVYDDGTHELIVAITRQGALAQFNSSKINTAKDISGIGDRAFYGNGRLGVLKGSSFMLLILSPYSATTPSPQLLTLGKSAASRLLPA